MAPGAAHRSSRDAEVGLAEVAFVLLMAIRTEHLKRLVEQPGLTREMGLVAAQAVAFYR